MNEIVKFIQENQTALLIAGVFLLVISLYLLTRWLTGVKYTRLFHKHMKDKRSAVYIHSQKTSLKPLFRMVHDYVPKEIAKVLEGEYKDKYSDEGWNILNRVKTGDWVLQLGNYPNSIFII